MKNKIQTASRLIGWPDNPQEAKAIALTALTNHFLYLTNNRITSCRPVHPPFDSNMERGIVSDFRNPVLHSENLK